MGKSSTEMFSFIHFELKDELFTIENTTRWHVVNTFLPKNTAFYLCAICIRFLVLKITSLNGTEVREGVAMDHHGNKEGMMLNIHTQ